MQVTSPFVVSASQYDSFQLHTNIGQAPPYDAVQTAFAEDIRVRTVAALQAYTSSLRPHTLVA
jgi:hypothetical protein